MFIAIKNFVKEINFEVRSAHNLTLLYHIL